MIMVPIPSEAAFYFDWSKCKDFYMSLISFKDTMI